MCDVAGGFFAPRIVDTFGNFDVLLISVIQSLLRVEVVNTSDDCYTD